MVWPPVDFVLESGSGDPDELPPLPTDDQPLDFDVPSPGQSIIPPDAPSLRHRVVENIPESVDLSSMRNNGDGSQQRLDRSVDMSRSVHPGPRSWPLRDPEEAALLHHFVDRIASFVSI